MFECSHVSTKKQQFIELNAYVERVKDDVLNDMDKCRNLFDLVVKYNLSASALAAVGKSAGYQYNTQSGKQRNREVRCFVCSKMFVTAYADTHGLYKYVCSTECKKIRIENTNKRLKAEAIRIKAIPVEEFIVAYQITRSIAGIASFFATDYNVVASNIVKRKIPIPLDNPTPQQWHTHIAAKYRRLFLGNIRVDLGKLVGPFPNELMLPYMNTSVWIHRFRIVALAFDGKCEGCGNNEWKGEKIIPSFVYIDGNERNRRPDNVRFLCSNCHASLLQKQYPNEKLYAWKPLAFDAKSGKTRRKAPRRYKRKRQKSYTATETTKPWAGATNTETP